MVVTRVGVVIALINLVVLWVPATVTVTRVKTLTLSPQTTQQLTQTRGMRTTKKEKRLAKID